MCEIMEELRRDSILEGIQEGIRKKQIETAQKMLTEGGFSFEMIAKITELTIEEVQALAESMSSQE